MNTRRFGRTGHDVREIGREQLGGTARAGLSDLPHRSTLIAAAGSGINLFDASDVYGTAWSADPFMKSIPRLLSGDTAENSDPQLRP